MDVNQWLAQKLDEPWSSHRLSAFLTGDIFDQVGRTVLDATTLTRFLLAILHLRPAQMRELQVDIDAFLSKCESSLSGRADYYDCDWAMFLIRLLKGFAKERRIDVDLQRLNLKDYINDLIASTDSADIRPYMIPPEAKYLDPSLLPNLVPESHQHFQVLHPFLFEQEGQNETDSTLASKPSKPTETLPVPVKPAIHKVPPPAPPPAKRFLSSTFNKKATINRMGLEDVAQLQDRMKRTRPITDDSKRKEKVNQKLKDKAEKEQKRMEERDLKKKKKDDEKETRRIERELVKQKKNRVLMEQAEQREKEAVDRAAREAAEAFVRQNSQNSLMTPAHLLAQIQSSMFSNPSYTQLMMMPPMPSIMDAPVAEADKSPYASMFIGANALSPVNRSLIESFLAGDVVSHPEAHNGILQVVMSENCTQDANLDQYLEIVVFEMNFMAGSWRKLKRRKRLSQQPVQI